MDRPRRLESIWRRHDPNLRHHAPVLMFENMAVIDEIAELAERNVEHDRRRGAVAAPPLLDGADAALVVHHLIAN